MAFQTKDFTSIVASMINWMKASTQRISDYNVGSVVRSMLEAVAGEVDELYQQMFIGIKEAIPVATYNSFDFDSLPAISAAGIVRVQLTPSLTDAVIAAGTTIAAPGLPTTYTSTTDTTVAAGASFVDVRVIADAAGTVGNITAGQAFTLTPSPENFVSATNLSAFSSGQDAETEDERKIRFAAYIASISRSTTAALRYGLSTAVLRDADGNITERVATSVIIEPYLQDAGQPIALVECYVHNGVGNTSLALVAEATKIVEGYYDEFGAPIEGYKAAGVKTPVYAAPEILVDVTGTVTILEGYDLDAVIASASSTIFAYIQGLGIGESALFSDIIAIVKALDGVYDFELVEPAENVVATRKQKLMPGAIDLT